MKYILRSVKTLLEEMQLNQIPDAVRKDFFPDMQILKNKYGNEIQHFDERLSQYTESDVPELSTGIGREIMNDLLLENFVDAKDKITNKLIKYPDDPKWQEIITEVENDNFYYAADTLADNIDDDSKEHQATYYIGKAAADHQDWDAAEEAISEVWWSSFKGKLRKYVAIKKIELENLFNEASNLLSNINDSEIASEAYHDASLISIDKGDFNWATNYASQINDQTMHDNAYYDIAISAADVEQFNEARNAASQINDETIYDNTYYDIAISAADVEQFNEACNAASQINDSGIQNDAYNYIENKGYTC